MPSCKVHIYKVAKFISTKLQSSYLQSLHMSFHLILQSSSAYIGGRLDLRLKGQTTGCSHGNASSKCCVLNINNIKQPLSSESPRAVERHDACGHEHSCSEVAKFIFGVSSINHHFCARGTIEIKQQNTSMYVDIEQLLFSSDRNQRMCAQTRIHYII